MTHIIHSNVNIYAAIAEEAFADMEERLANECRPGTDGNGWIRTFDPSQRSFKSALVYITFSAMWLESILHLRIADRLGKSRAKRFDRKSYEEKLEFLGVSDTDLSRSLCEFRDLRREIIHEKAYFEQSEIRFAQKEARKVRRMIRNVQGKLDEAEA